MFYKVLNPAGWVYVLFMVAAIYVCKLCLVNV